MPSKATQAGFNADSGTAKGSVADRQAREQAMHRSLRIMANRNLAKRTVASFFGVLIYVIFVLTTPSYEDQPGVVILFGVLLLLSLVARVVAAKSGRTDDDLARDYPGDRPSSTILLQRLDAHTLGALIAFYEHRTFANAVLLGINPFDQFGVELGKEMARSFDNPEGRQALDPSTRDLIERAGL